MGMGILDMAEDVSKRYSKYDTQGFQSATDSFNYNTKKSQGSYVFQKTTSL